MPRQTENEPPTTPPVHGAPVAASASEADTVREAILPGPKRSPLYAFQFRNFRLFFYGQTISVVGTWMQTVAQNWLVWELTRSAQWLGIVNGVSAIPFVLFALWGGQLADRLPRRSILIWTQVAMMALAFALAALATNRWVPIQAWHIVALSALSSIVNALNMPAQQAFVTDMVEEREALGNAIALNSLRFNLARFVGPIFAGKVLDSSSAAVCFTLNGLSFLAVIVSLLMMRLPAFQPKEQSGSIWEGFRYIRQSPRVLRIVLLIGFGAVFTWSHSTLFPVFATRFGAGVSGYSGMMSANGIGAALGGLALASFGDRIPRYWAVYGGAIGFCLAILLFSVTPLYSLALAVLVLCGFLMILFGISSNTRVQEEVPDSLRGRVMAVYSLVFNGLFPVGGLEVGYLADRIGPIPTIRLNASLCLLFTLLILAWSRRDRRTSR